MLYIITSLVISLNAIGQQERRNRDIPVTALRQERLLPSFDHLQMPTCAAVENPRPPRLSDCLVGFPFGQTGILTSGHTPAGPDVVKEPRLPKPVSDAKVRVVGPKFLPDPADAMDLKSPSGTSVASGEPTPP